MSCSMASGRRTRERVIGNGSPRRRCGSRSKQRIHREAALTDTLKSTLCNRGRPRTCPGAAGRGPAVAALRHRRPPGAPGDPGRRQPPCTSAASPRTTPRIWACRHLPGVRPGPSPLAGLRARRALRAEHHRRRRSAVRAGRARRHRLARPRPTARPSCSARTWRRCGCCRRRTTSAPLRLLTKSSSWWRSCWPPAPPTSSTTPSTRTSTSAPTPRSSSATSPATTATPCCGCSPNAAATPTAPAKGRLDALLWRAERPGEPSWPSPFGPGRPGWHVECAAIALNRIGTDLDIQGGGSDLIFPHHEFSAAHAESVTGERRFARHYVHAGMIGWDGHKMSQEPRQPGPGVAAAGRGRRPRSHPARTARRALSRRPLVEPDQVSTRPTRGWSDGERRRATRAPVATDMVARLRQLSGRRSRHAESACRTGWLDDRCARYGGHDTEAPGRWPPPSTHCLVSSCSDDPRAHRFSRSCGRSQ